MQDILHHIQESEGPDMKPRPIKMVLESEDSKDKVLRGAKT